MIDWFSGLIGYDGSQLRLRQLVELSADGQESWRVDRGEPVRGSFDSSLLVGRSSASAGMIAASRQLGYPTAGTVLKLSGNPTKWLQGQNVFGPSVEDLGPVLRETVRSLPQPWRPPDADEDGLRAVHRSRVDVAVQIAIGTESDVHDWLRAMELRTRSRHGRAMVSGTTVYLGRGSKRWTIKAYCKRCELLVHRPVGHSVEELRDLCEGQVRLELQLRRPELKDRGTLSRDIVFEFWEKVVVGVSDEKLSSLSSTLHSYDLPNIVKFTLSEWLNGRDVVHALPRATFYRHRRLILDTVHVDISLPPRDQELHVERAGFTTEWLRARWVQEERVRGEQMTLPLVIARR